MLLNSFQQSLSGTLGTPWGGPGGAQEQEAELGRAKGPFLSPSESASWPENHQKTMEKLISPKMNKKKHSFSIVFFLIIHFNVHFRCAVNRGHQLTFVRESGPEQFSPSIPGIIHP